MKQTVLCLIILICAPVLARADEWNREAIQTSLDRASTRWGVDAYGVLGKRRQGRGNHEGKGNGTFQKRSANHAYLAE